VPFTSLWLCHCYYPSPVLFTPSRTSSFSTANVPGPAARGIWRNSVPRRRALRHVTPKLSPVTKYTVARGVYLCVLSFARPLGGSVSRRSYHSGNPSPILSVSVPAWILSFPLFSHLSSLACAPSEVLFPKREMSKSGSGFILKFIQQGERVREAP